jgi:sugar lactone lactonase YvrE
MKTFRTPVTLLALSLLAAGCANERSNDDTAALAAMGEVDLPGEQLFPEGVAIADDGTLYVGSLTDGSILQVLPGDEQPQVLVPTGEIMDRAIGSTVGLLVDDSLDVLWACDGGGLMGERSPAVVGISRDDGTVMARHEFPGNTGLCNDIAQDADGNLYASDSFSPRLVRVDADKRMSDGSAKDWATFDAWAVEPGQFGLNGLDVMGDQLYVAHTQNNAVYRVPVQADGSAGTVATLRLDRTPVGLDGLKAAGDGSLVFVEAYANAITRIELLPGDSGALEVIEDELDGPTTFAFYGDSAWIVEAQLSHLFDPMSGPPSLPFQVVRRELAPELMP